MTPLEKALNRRKCPALPDSCVVCDNFRVVGTGWYCGASGKLLIPAFAAETPVCRGLYLNLVGITVKTEGE